MPGPLTTAGWSTWDLAGSGRGYVQGQRADIGNATARSTRTITGFPGQREQRQGPEGELVRSPARRRTPREYRYTPVPLLREM